MKTPATWLVLACAGCAKVPSETAPARVAETAPSPAVAEAPATRHDEQVSDAGVAVDAAAGGERDAAPAPPNVTVISLGMHVGGGPFDEETKKPFLRAVEPHYAEVARCWAHVSAPKQADVGVDLVIPAAGGHAKVSHPRTTIDEAGFVPCVVAFFESIEFEKPSRGTAQALSYSVRFRP